MGTLVCLHAHPDDESISTAGIMRRAADNGHRVVLVVATRGEHGEVAEGVLADGEQLGLRRVAETIRSAEVLGASRVEFLGYVDSGMIGTPENDGDYSFWSADVDQAAHRLAQILLEESADVLTVYDANGGYGHPDHIQVHRVGVRAAEIAGTPGVYEATMNRDEIRATLEAAMENMTEEERAEMMDLDDPDTVFGSPASEITHAIDVSDFVLAKRASMRCHASQISEDDFFLQIPDDQFALAFGVEHFISHGKTRPTSEPMATEFAELLNPASPGTASPGTASPGTASPGTAVSGE